MKQRPSTSAPPARAYAPSALPPSAPPRTPTLVEELIERLEQSILALAGAEERLRKHVDSLVGCQPETAAVGNPSNDTLDSRVDGVATLTSRICDQIGRLRIP